MEALLDNWAVIVGIIALLTVIGSAVYRFINLPTSEQITRIKKWLLQAVILAEKEFGSGNGKLKLSFVYDMFISKFPLTAKIIPFEKFSSLVDGALDEMKELLKDNKPTKKRMN